RHGEATAICALSYGNVRDYYRGSPSSRSPMIVRCTSEVPPAIDAAFDHSHWRCQKPSPGLSSAPHQSGDAAPTTSSARADSACDMSDHASFVMLDSGPGSLPFV